MITKVLILVVAAYLAFRFLSRPKSISPPEDVEISDDVFVDYEEVKDE